MVAERNNVASFALCIEMFLMLMMKCSSAADVAALAASHAATMRYHTPRRDLLDINDGDGLGDLVQEQLQTLNGSDMDKTFFHTSG